ncbi:hypothetical protein NSND_62879 [Nitrospira sp. ND1]|nr:hypothetical protein NSND_62879 [Nitrospira sp. ND1]
MPIGDVANEATKFWLDKMNVTDQLSCGCYFPRLNRNDNVSNARTGHFYCVARKPAWTSRP